MKNNAKNQSVSKSDSHSQKHFNRGFAAGKRWKYQATVETAAKAFESTMQAAVELGKAQVAVIATLAEKVESQDAKECFGSTLTFLQNVDQNSNETFLKSLDLTYSFLDAQVERAIPLAIQMYKTDEARAKARALEAEARTPIHNVHVEETKVKAKEEADIKYKKKKSS